jgi:hypothetical protein
MTVLPFQSAAFVGKSKRVRTGTRLFAFGKSSLEEQFRREELTTAKEFGSLSEIADDPCFLERLESRLEALGSEHLKQFYRAYLSDVN